ncbi:MAG: anti-sigma factor antagonist [Defluviitaleaceae bacterium]|nr:anti-sigma factor antagonist [Defluviitaleaceae bacterium]
MGLQLNIEGNALIARPDCEIDHHSAERMRGQIDAVFDNSSCRHIIFDFSGVNFMDSSGIGMIIGRYKNAEKRGGRLALAGMSDEMGRLFHISGLAKIITRTATVEEAHAYFREHLHAPNASDRRGSI